MAQQPFFSIVMPVYGVEKYLQAAVDSVLRQTFSDFELILVDDCSVDGSGKICETLARRDCRIRVFHNEKNLGLSLTRNVGLGYARGHYIWFMDSDDVVDDSLLQQVWDSLQKNKAQLVLWGIQEEYFDEKGNLRRTTIIDYPEYFFRSPEELRPHMIELEKRLLYGYAWNKIYDLSYLKNLGLQFEKITLIEDIVFNVKYCMDITGLNILGTAPYHYAKRGDGSLTTKYVPEYYELHQHRTRILMEQYETWGMSTPQVQNSLGCMHVRYIYSAMQRNCDKRAGMTHRMRRNWMRQLYKDNLYLALIPVTQPRSLSMRWMLCCLKHRWTTLSLFTARVIYLIKNKMPMIFAALKVMR